MKRVLTISKYRIILIVRDQLIYYVLLEFLLSLFALGVLHPVHSITYTKESSFVDGGDSFEG